MSEWKDITSYSRGGSRVPTTWQIRDDQITVTVVFGHRDLPGAWCFHCPQLGIDTHQLPKATTEQEAKRDALLAADWKLGMMRASLANMRKGL